MSIPCRDMTIGGISLKGILPRENKGIIWTIGIAWSELSKTMPLEQSEICHAKNSHNMHLWARGMIYRHFLHTVLSSWMQKQHAHRVKRFPTHYIHIIRSQRNSQWRRRPESNSSRADDLCMATFFHTIIFLPPKTTVMTPGWLAVVPQMRNNKNTLEKWEIAMLLLVWAR